jgi:hypothetical protein
MGSLQVWVRMGGQEPFIEKYLYNINFTKKLSYEKFFWQNVQRKKKKEIWYFERLGVYRADSFITELTL